ncbi:rCG46938 [Rattus norvegicus]|uniref:RCG46938 n=1 Tax=Rattus norvegicus TaxID=10116 RepID=A6IXT3_RAT|nr:rCG46938 [Rattus norvegicus]
MCHLTTICNGDPMPSSGVSVDSNSARMYMK